MNKLELQNFVHFKKAEPSVVRQAIRNEKFTGQTSGCCEGHLQCNVTIVDSKHNKSLENFCLLNPKAAPLLEIMDGTPFTSKLGKDIDIRTDVPRYEVYTIKHNKIDCKEVLNIKEYWNKGMTTFLTGCSFSFEDELMENKIPMYHIQYGRNVSMYNTNIPINSVDGFGKDLVVSMRLIPHSMLWNTCQITEKYWMSHGAPFFVGHPSIIGIKNINKCDYGDDPVFNEANKNDVPCFWACGVTVKNTILHALEQGVIDFAITHKPGHMIITDIPLINAAKILRSPS